jgi:hypothetical protein
LPVKVHIKYDKFRDGETELRLVKINQFYNENLKQLDLLKEEKATVHPSKKFSAVSIVTDSLLNYTITYFQLRKDLILMVEDMKSTIDLFHQSQAEYDEHVNALKVSNSWSNHHRTMVDFEGKKMIERKEKIELLSGKIKDCTNKFKSMESVFYEAEKAFMSENTSLQITQSINIASVLFEKENTTEILITKYSTSSLGELLIKTE